MIVANPLAYSTYVEAVRAVEEDEISAWIFLEQIPSEDEMTMEEYGEYSLSVGRIRLAVYEKYQSRARRIARRFIDKLPYSPLVGPDDIEGEAFYGLWQAILSYQLGYGTAFMTHATSRIRGAIIDGLRKLQNFPRLIAKARREVKPLIEELAHKLGRIPQLSDIKQHYAHYKVGGVLGFSISEILDDPLMTASVFNQLGSSGNTDKDQPENNAIEDAFTKTRQSVCITSVLDRRDHVEKILSLFPRNTQREKDCRSVFYMYYYNNMTITRISRIKGQSTSWVSSMKKAAEEFIKNRKMEVLRILEIDT